MGRPPYFLAWLLLSACGARTGLGIDLVESRVLADAGVDADASMDADADDAAVHPCPVVEPNLNASCEISATNQCDYLAPDSMGITCRSCMFETWASCTTVAYTMFTSCSDIGCAPGEYVECIAPGPQCCTCSADGTADQCDGC
jgi:hypothetical protein